MNQKSFRPLVSLFIAPLLGLFVSHPVPAVEPVHLEFVSHAAFFSKEMHLSMALDPQVFVPNPTAPAGVGPQNIRHVAGFRNLAVSEATDMEIFSAEGKRLGVTAGAWLGARGTVTITPAARGADVVAHFQGLKPHGGYSLFENHFDVKPVGFTPLDGRGTTNSFVVRANGTATVHVHSQEMLTSANAVLLVYHSDGKTHGASRGEIGITAHHQLIAKLP